MFYKGFTIKIQKENEGYSFLVYRKTDAWILADEWNPSLKTKQETLEEIHIIIDDYLENPEAYD
ncbi:MAG: hypothetical protein PHS54_07440 [Clostridia bacterium]|nr:hypothetical protein [Clostridia bacterium]